MRFRARRIEMGRVTGVVEFDAPDSASAWSTAHDGIDPLSGEWVEVTPVIEADADRGAAMRDVLSQMDLRDECRDGGRYP